MVREYAMWLNCFDCLIEFENRVDNEIDYCFSYGAGMHLKTELESSISYKVETEE
jgi:hypothetical protein